LEFTQESIDAQAATSRDGISQLNLLGKWIPLVGGILGAVCLIGGVVLVVVGSRRKD
jgi:hypothetical protein